jgi:hypothetical protein
MIFIDSDIGFDPNDVVLLLALLDHEDKACPYDIVCGPYPKKRIVWEKIKRAVEQGYADDDANKLSEFASNYVFILRVIENPNLMA